MGPPPAIVGPPVFGGSLYRDFEAEAAVALAARQGMERPPRVNKRKRATRLTISDRSIIFQFAEQLLAKSNLSASAPSRSAENDCDTKSGEENVVDLSDVDSLIEWGREHVADAKFKNGSVTLDSINTDALKFVLAGAIKCGDVVEKVQYTRNNQPPKMATILPPKQICKLAGKRRCRPYYRSDHYTTFYCENKPAAALANILREEKNFPLYVTVKRPKPGANMSSSAGSAISPPRKRLKRSESGVTKQPKDEVICLLDSSDEEGEKDGTKGQTQKGAIEIDSPNNSPSSALAQCVPPDPQPMPHDDEDFVLTPYGAGKIVSSRVERYPSSDKRSEATMFKPTIMYTIDLHYGTVHLPASKVKRITGTHFTEKTLLTYQRAPLTAHDLLRLRPMTYLNDNLINFYLKHLKSQYDEKNNTVSLTGGRGWDDLDGEGIHIFPTFCYTRIKNILGPNTRNSKMVRTKIWKDLRSWTKNTDIFKKKVLVFPINEHLHWTCVFVFHPGRLVRRYAKGLRGKKDDVKVVNLNGKVTGAKVPHAPVNPVPSTAKLSGSNPAGYNVAQVSSNPAPLMQGKQGTAQVINLESNAAGLNAEQVTANTEPVTTDVNSKATSTVMVRASGNPGPGATDMESKTAITDVESVSVDQAHANLDCKAGGPNITLATEEQTQATQTTDSTMQPAAHATFNPAPTNVSNDDKESCADKNAEEKGAQKSDAARQPEAQVRQPEALVSVNPAPGATASNCSEEDEKNDSAEQPESQALANPETDKTVANSGEDSATNVVVEQKGCQDTEAAKDHVARAPAPVNPAPDAEVPNEVKQPAVNVDAKVEGNGSQNANAVKQPQQPQANVNASQKPATKRKVKWQCDFCKKAQFDTFEEAVDHEKICDDNLDWCMLHFDSGKHFQLHKTGEITGNIRKYLNAYYEAEYGSTHPGLSSFTMKNMPAFTVSGVPQQDNTKDCGVYMLENAERLLNHTPTVDCNFVKKKGAVNKSFFGEHNYDKHVIEKKRVDILQLVQTMRRAEMKVD